MMKHVIGYKQWTPSEHKSYFICKQAMPWLG